MEKIHVKQFFIISFCLVISQFSFGQEDFSEFEKGKSLLSFGVGFPNTYHAGVDLGTSILGGITGLDTNDDNGSSSPQLILNYEYGITENIGIGLYSAYFSADNEILTTANLIGGLFGSEGGVNVGETNYSVVSIGGKLAVHEQLINKLDTYATTYVGYNIVNQDDINVSSDPLFSVFGNAFTVDDAVNLVNNEISYPTFSYEVNVGGRYYFSEKFAGYGEAGLGRYLVNAGLTYSF